MEHFYRQQYPLERGERGVMYLCWHALRYIVEWWHLYSVRKFDACGRLYQFNH